MSKQTRWVMQALACHCELSGPFASERGRWRLPALWRRQRLPLEAVRGQQERQARVCLAGNGTGHAGRLPFCPLLFKFAFRCAFLACLVHLKDDTSLELGHVLSLSSNTLVFFLL